MSELTLSQRIARAEAAIECDKIMSRHCYYHAAGIQREEIEEFWTKREDCTWAHNFGQMNTRTNYIECYADNQEENVARLYEELEPVYPEVAKVKDHRALVEVAMHLLASPIIEVAEDGESAKGLWYTPGCIFSTLNPQKAKEGSWIWERYGADFIIEDGEWVYLNLKVCCDIAGPIDKENWPLAGGFGPPPPSDDEDAGGPPPGPVVGIPGPLHYNLSETQLPQSEPYIPEPYRTFSETYSYATLTGIYEGKGK